MDTLIRGATLCTLNASREILRADLLVHDGVIAAIGKIPPARSPRTVIEAGGLVAIPGLVQAHVHLCQTLFRNHADGLELLDWLRERIWPFEAAHSAETQAVRDRVGLDNIDYFEKLGLLGPRAALAHGVWLTAHEQRRVAETKTSLVHCPSSNLKLASGIAKVPELAGAGVHWALGCDG